MTLRRTLTIVLLIAVLATLPAGIILTTWWGPNRSPPLVAGDRAYLARRCAIVRQFDTQLRILFQKQRVDIANGVRTRVDLDLYRVGRLRRIAVDVYNDSAAHYLVADLRAAGIPTLLSTAAWPGMPLTNCGVHINPETRYA